MFFRMRSIGKRNVVAIPDDFNDGITIPDDLDNGVGIADDLDNGVGIADDLSDFDDNEDHLWHEFGHCNSYNECHAEHLAPAALSARGDNQYGERHCCSPWASKRARRLRSRMIRRLKIPI